MANEKLPLIMDSHFIAAQHIDMLDGATLDKGRRGFHKTFTFHQNKALIRRAMATLDFLHAIGIEVIPWPARSLNHNVIENARECLMNVA